MDQEAGQERGQEAAAGALLVLPELLLDPDVLVLLEEEPEVLELLLELLPESLEEVPDDPEADDEEPEPEPDRLSVR
ncbi:MAG: hypothetical protein ACPF9W_11395 [Nocardioides sp.]